MRPKSIRRHVGLPFAPSLALVTALTAFATANASADTYQWSGTTSGLWTTASNWSAPTGVTAGPAPTGTTFAHRLNINNAIAANVATYNFTGVTTTYANSATGLRGLVIGNGTNGSLFITAGTFSTLGSSAPDLISNATGTTAASGALTINGGTYVGTNAGLAMGIGSGTGTRTAVFNILSGSATVANLDMNTTTATVNLDGGTLALNKITRTSGTGRLNLNGGTLIARQNDAAFISGLSSLLVKSGGAIIDTNGFNVGIAHTLAFDPASPGGGLIKKSSGLLTLGLPATITGPVTVEAGGFGVKGGPTTWSPSSLAHSGDALNFDLGVYSASNPALITVPNLTLNTTDIIVNIAGSNIPVSSEIRILDYGTKSGPGSLKLGTLPLNMVATLQENTVDGYYFLNVTTASGTAFTWSRGTGNWDFSSLNWNSNLAAYSEPALATFPTITGESTVTLTADVAPVTLNISNVSPTAPNVANYIFAGSGKITGSTGITKTGTGFAKFGGAAHEYTGPVAINGGSLIKQVADTTTGNITLGADATSFVLDGGITDGANQTLTIRGGGAPLINYFYTGSVTQRGALQGQNGSNTWQGNIVLSSNLGSGNTNRIGVQDGASLTLTGTISESVTKAPLLFRAGAAGHNINLNGAGTYSYTGQTQIFSTGGSVKLGADNKLPTGSNLDFLTNSNIPPTTSVFDLNGFNQEVLSISGSATGNEAIITNNGSGPSTLTVNNPAETPTEAIDLYRSLIADGISSVFFVKNGNGTQNFSAANTYSGTTTVNAGQLDIKADQLATGDVIVNGGSVKLSQRFSLYPGVNLFLASGAFFYTDGTLNQVLGKLEGNGTVDSTFAGEGIDVITVGANNATSTFAGVLGQSTSQGRALTKIGTGSFTLTGLNLYSGNTIIEDGTLSVAQSNFADTSTVSIGLAAASAAVLNLPNVGTDIVTALIIDGVSQPGNGLLYDAGNSGGAITGSGKIQVGTAAASGYAAWATTNNVLLGEFGDDDSDGTLNIVEYALGLNPQIGSPAPGSFTANTLTFIKGAEAKSAGDVIYDIETSTTLQAGSWTIVVATKTANDISFPLPANQAGGKLFARLRVSKPNPVVSP